MATSAAGKHDSAIIVGIENYDRMGERTGARALAGAWYRYFRGSRGLRPRRIVLLRDGEATPKRLAEAIETVRFRSHRHGTLWFVFIGHISSAAQDGGGDLWLQGGDGTPGTAGAHSVPIAQVLDRVAYGRHPQAVAVLDGCWTREQPGERRSGAVALPPPPFRPTGQIDEAWSVYPVVPGSKTLGALVYESLNRTHAESVRSRREPSDVAIYSAGVGASCVERLPGTNFPALSYLMLGALRGWADGNGDGAVTSVEALRQVTMMLRAATDAATPRPGPGLYGADITLARGVAEAGPTLAQMSAPGPAPAATAQLLAEPLLWAKDRMIRFDRGNFKMGCARRGDPECESDERPAYRVDLSRFFIDPLEVTQTEYQACVSAGGCTPIDPGRCFVWTGATFERRGRMPEVLFGAEQPVVCVNWFQARAYCANVGKRLPTEAEWERAAAGTTRRRYPWGEAAPSCGRAHFDGCGEHTRPVGGRTEGATPEGVHDLAGNVSEWVLDWYDPKEYWRPFRDDPTGPDHGVVRVVRGGSYYDNASSLRNSYRYGLNPTSGFSTVGLRCAR